MYESLLKISIAVTLFIFVLVLLLSLYKKNDVISSLVFAGFAFAIVLTSSILASNLVVISYSSNLVHNTQSYTISQDYLKEVDSIVEDISYGLYTRTNFNTAVEMYARYKYNSNTSNDIYTFFLEEGTQVLTTDSYTVTTDAISIDVKYIDNIYCLSIYPRPKIDGYRLSDESCRKIIDMCKVTRKIEV